MPSQKNSLVVVGSGWQARVVAGAFGRAGGVPKLILLSQSHEWPFVVAHAGTGEYPETAEKILGSKLKKSLWGFSERNFKKAVRLGNPCDVSWEEAGKLVLKEKGVLLKTASLEPAPHCEIVKDVTVTMIKKSGPMDYRIESSSGDSWSASVVVCVSDRMPQACLPWLNEKWIPVTLSSFVFEPAKEIAGLSLFHAGIDFGFCAEDGLHLGSYRNLYLDKAVGVLSQADPATLQGVKGFFSQQGWIKGEAVKTLLTVESVSCDGLPIVGTLGDSPGVYFLGGFSGRSQNFVFEVAEQLAAGVVKGSGFSGLEPFSTKRFL